MPGRPSLPLARLTLVHLPTLWLSLPQGCANAVRRVLGKLEGVQSVDIDLPQQKVTVESTSDPEVVKAQVAKSGKKTELWA